MPGELTHMAHGDGYGDTARSLQHGRPRAQRGFSLVEVLVTTVIFSIGVLGVAGLSVYSKRAGFDAVQRSTAAELGYGLLENMRSNSAALDVYLAAGPLGGGSQGAEPAPTCSTAASSCTSAELAAHSLWEWEQKLDGGMESADGVGTGGLVEPTACISGPAGGVTGDYTVTLVWRGVNELADPDMNDCGAGSGLYGTDNAYRRMTVVQTFIDPDL